MSSKRKKKLGGDGETRRRRAEDRPADLREFLRRAPNFSALLHAAEGRERELSPSQRDFLDDFAAKLTEGAPPADGAS